MLLDMHDVRTLQAMKRHCEKAVALTCRFADYDGFVADDDAPAALAMYLTQVGELAKKQLSDAAKRMCPAIPWSAMYGMRNRIVHGYGELEFTIIWDTACEHIPLLVAEIDALLIKAYRSKIQDLELNSGEFPDKQE